METIDEEEIKEQLKEEMAKFEDDGYFRRLIKMFVGLGRPRNSPEYKEAIVELQRQTAPLLAILLPILVVATLFVVKCHKERGLSLVEIKKEFERSDASENGCAMLEDQVSLMLDRRDELERQIACGRLLVAAMKGRAPLRKLVRSYVMRAVVDAASAQEKSDANAYFALLQRCVLISVGEVGKLEKSIREWLDKGEKPDAGCVRGFFREEFERTAQLVEGSTQAGVARALGEVLDSPSMEPTLELWLGPGSYEFIDEALSVALAAKA